MFLSDGVVSLRPIHVSDLTLLARWRNESELRTRTREFRPLTERDQTEWLQRISGPHRTDFMFIADAEVSFGVFGLCHWSPRDRTAEVSFYVGDVGMRGRGHARRGIGLLHKYGFQELGLDRIWAEVYEFNDASVGLLETLGYAREGQLRKHVFRNGVRCDSILMGILREEWHGGVRNQEPSV